jgi:hypothetical protein
MSNCSWNSAQTFVHPLMQIQSLEVNVLYFEVGPSFDGFWDNVMAMNEGSISYGIVKN